MGRLHLAITVLEGAAATAAVVAADKVKECGNEDQKDNGKQLKVSEKTTSSVTDVSKSSLSVPAPHAKTADEYEPINIEGQEAAGIWVHRPGSDVSQKWEPRKGRNRHPDTELQREDVDCADSRRSMTSDSQQSDVSSNDDNLNGNKVRPLGTIKKGIKKMGSLFHKSPRGESPKYPGEYPLPTQRPNLKPMNERSVSVKLVLDEDVAKDIAKNTAASIGLSPEKEEAEGPGRGHKREMAKDILKQVGKSAHQLKCVLSRKGSSKSKEGAGVPKDVDSLSSASSTGEESLPPSIEHTFIVDGLSMESASPPSTGERQTPASPSTGEKQTPIDAETLRTNEGATEPNPSTAVSRGLGVTEEGHDHGVDYPVSAKDLNRSPARKVSFRLADQAEDGKAAGGVPVDHPSEGSPKAGT